MTGFKLTKITFMYFSVLAMALAGCTKAEKHKLQADDVGRQVQFRMNDGEVVDVSGYERNVIISGDITAKRLSDTSTTEAGLSNRREYSLELCGITDVFMPNGSLLGQQLEIFSELPIIGKSVQPIATSNSCVAWIVGLPYNFIATSVNLEVNFIFRTVGNRKAFIQKTVMFNPWDAKRGTNPEFYDFTRFGLSDEMRNMNWARGLKDIQAALKGDLFLTTRKLEIGSVSIVPQTKEEYQANTVGSAANATAAEQRANQIHMASMKKDANGKPIEPVSQSLDMQLNIALQNIKVRLKDSAGNIQDQELKEGRYRIEAQLTASGVKEKSSEYYILTDLMPLGTPDWMQSTMGVNAVLPLSVAIRQDWGNLNLVLRVTPLDVPGVNAFEAIYLLGRFDELGSSKSPIIKVSEYSRDANSPMGLSFGFDQYITGATNHADWLKGMAARGVKDSSTLQAENQTFTFTPLSVLFSRIMTGDTATDRTIQYTVDTCLVHVFNSRRPRKGLAFVVKTTDRDVPVSVVVKTDDQGCLHWVGMVSHKVYQRENLYPKTSELTFVGDTMAKDEDVIAQVEKDELMEKATGEKYKLLYYINPWDEKFTFGRDSRALPEKYIQQIAKDQESAPPTRVLMTDFRYDATGFRYVIDKYMNITVKKTVLMTIHPKVLKYNSIVWGRSGFSELRDGIYLLKIAMQKDYLDTATPGQSICKDNICNKNEVDRHQTKRQFLVIKEMLVRVLGGLIVTPVEFDLTDLRTLRIRSQMLIQIETIDETLLRAMVLVEENLKTKLAQVDVSKVINVLNLDPSIEPTLQQINDAFEEAKATADLVELQKKIAQIDKEHPGYIAQLQAIAPTIGLGNLRKAIAVLDDARRAGEGSLSALENLKYQTNNEALIALTATAHGDVNSEQQQAGQMGVLQRQGVVEKYRTTQTAECERMVKTLNMQNRVDEAKLWDPAKANTEGYLCKTDLPAEEAFYAFSSDDYIGSEAWLKDLFTPAQFELYKTGRLLDDFSRAPTPDFDFNLLSNQGDEIISKDAQGVVYDHKLSGLPRRTFIGPVTFVLNGNSSAMRPTDVLDEHSCQGTCAQPNDADADFALAFKPEETRLRDESEVKADAIKQFGPSVNAAYEDSPYYGSISHFYKKQVNDLIPVQKGLRQQYIEEMEAYSHIGNLLNQMYHQYVSFGPDQKAVKALDYDCFYAWKSQIEDVYAKWRSGEDMTYQIPHLSDKCFKMTDRAIHKNTFIRNFNARKATQTEQYSGITEFDRVSSIPDINEADLKEFSKNGLQSKVLPFATKINVLHKMCYMIRKNVTGMSEADLRRILTRKITAKYDAITGGPTAAIGFGMVGFGPEGVRTRVDSIMMRISAFEDDCHNMVDTYAKDVTTASLGLDDQGKRDMMAIKARQLPMILERKVRVQDTTDRYIYKDGKTINYSVGISFGESNAMNINRGYKVDPLATATKLGGLVGGKEGPIAKVSNVIGAFGEFFSFTWGMAETKSQTNGTNVSSGTTIAGQISTLDIEIGKWEKCLVMRTEEKYLVQFVESIKSDDYDPTEYVKNLGVVMCSGDKDTVDDLGNGTDPLRVRERYYYFTQIFNEGDMQDPGALFNHPWMIQLRGMRDFASFHQALTVTKDELSWLSAYGLMFTDIGSALQGFRDKRHNEGSSLQVVAPDDVDKALDMMADAYKKALPTFPGMYTFSDTSDDRVTDWPQQTSTGK